ncbi:MAG TPA: TolC family protein [Polyangia bacterium]|nr:TolC family protein [Polyangia bacterium]
MKTQRTIVLGTAAILTASVIAAAQADTATNQLTLDQTLALARKNNPGLVVDRAKLAEAETTVEQAWSVLFPTVSAQVKYTHNNAKADSQTFASLLGGGSGAAGMTGAMASAGPSFTLQPLDQWDYSVSAAQPILAPAAYPAVDAVKANYAAAKAGYDVSDANTLVATARAFLACAAADEARAARRSGVEVAQATLKNAETRQAAGTVTKVDVDRAQLALVRAEQAEREAAFGQEQTYRALGTLIGVDGAFQIQPEIPTAPLPDASDAEMALHLRPEFRELEESEKSYDAQRKAQAWRWAPSISAFGNARYFPGYIAFTGQHYAWAVGAELDWAIYDGGGRDAQRHLASAQLAEARAQTELLRRTIRDDLANGRSNLDTKRHGVESAQRSVDLANETLELVRVQYEAGTGTQLDLLQAQDAIVNAKVGLAQAHFDVAAADLQFRYAAGTFPPKQ